MVAVTRWVQYETSAVGYGTLGQGAGGRGTRGYHWGINDPGDEIDIGPTTNRLHIAMGAGDTAPYITLASGTELDPRFVARDVTEKMHALGKSTETWDNAICTWENTTLSGSYTKRNRFVIRSGRLGSASSVTVSGGTNSAHTVLGYDVVSAQGKSGGSNTPDGIAAYNFDGTITLSGTYYGFFDEVYKIVISDDNDAVRGIGTATQGGSQSYGPDIITGGAFNATSDIQYVIEIMADLGTTMGGGTGFVPRMRWTANALSDGQTDWTELLYPDYWYKVGSYGLMVKFSDAVFSSAPTSWTIQCYKSTLASPGNATDTVGQAYFMYSSDRGDMGGATQTAVSGSYTRLGTRGLYVGFDPTNAGDELGAGDTFYVICRGPQPDEYGITSVNYGNVTVTDESSMKNVMFEIESGAVILDTVRFGLQSHGNFSHHDAGNTDTEFRFGVVGPGNTAGNSPIDGIEWYPDIDAALLITAPDYLYSTNTDLPVVSTADASEVVGNYPLKGMTGDPVWINIKSGGSENGDNSTINYRLYFDYQ